MVLVCVYYIIISCTWKIYNLAYCAIYTLRIGSFTYIHVCVQNQFLRGKNLARLYRILARKVLYCKNRNPAGFFLDLHKSCKNLCTDPAGSCKMGSTGYGYIYAHLKQCKKFQWCIKFLQE